MRSKKYLFLLITIGFGVAALGETPPLHAGGVQPTFPPPAGRPTTPIGPPQTERDQNERVYHLLTEVRYLRLAARYDGPQGEWRRQQSNRVCSRLQAHVDDLNRQIADLQRIQGLQGPDRRVQALQDELRAFSNQNQHCSEFQRELQVAQEVAGIRGIQPEMATRGIDRSLALGLDNVGRRETMELNVSAGIIPKNFVAASLVLGPRFTAPLLRAVPRQLAQAEVKLEQVRRRGDQLDGQAWALQSRLNGFHILPLLGVRRDLANVNYQRNQANWQVQQLEDKIAEYEQIQTLLGNNLAPRG